LPTEIVGLADDGGLCHRGMPQQRTFDLERPNAVAGAFDHVASAAFEPEIAVLVAASEIAGDDPAVALDVARRLRIVPIPQPIPLPRLAPAAERAHLPVRQPAACCVDTRQPIARRWKPI